MQNREENLATLCVNEIMQGIKSSFLLNAGFQITPLITENCPIVSINLKGDEGVEE